MMENLILYLNKLDSISFVKLLRLKHWSKSSFVMLGFLFSGHWSSHLYHVIFAALAFSIISSAVYLYNDIKDINYDREHPIKKNRPIASSIVTISSAKTLLSILLCIGLFLGWCLSIKAVTILLLYLIINFFYSNGLKHYAYIDVLCISSGFMLRILMGTWAIGIEPSVWLLICGTFFSLFLALSKRKLEVDLLINSQGIFRPVLNKYNNRSLTTNLWLTAILTIVSYCTYLLFRGNGALNIMFYATLPIVILSFVRYAFLINKKTINTCPVALVMHDKISMLCLFIFTVFVILGTLL